MHDHIKQPVEEIINQLQESLSYYNAIAKDNLRPMSIDALNSIIQSKENILSLLLKEFHKIYPDFKPTILNITTQSIDIIISQIIELENKIIKFTEANLIPNIPSKNHEGIYTIAVSIKSNSEASLVKLNSIKKARGKLFLAPSSSQWTINSSYHLMQSLILFEKMNLLEEITLCKTLIDKSISSAELLLGKKLILYTPLYGETYASISSKFNMSLSMLLKINHVPHPFSLPSCKYLLILKDLDTASV